MVVPLASVLSSIAIFIASKKIREHLSESSRQNVPEDMGNRLSVIQ
jgi:hypothetical protein